MIRIDVKADVRKLRAELDDFAKRQVRFATAQALNAVAKAGIEAERQAMSRDLDRPRPFTTQQGLRLKSARKDDLEAAIAIPPIQSRYLAPEIEGGLQVLPGSSRAILRPINQATDQYGNLPRNLLSRLKGRPDIFIGTVKTKSGPVDGVWQRIIVSAGGTAVPTHIRHRGTWLAGQRATNERHSLRLLIRFSDPIPVKTRYPFGQAAIATVKRMFPGELRRQLALAIRTAR